MIHTAIGLRRFGPDSSTSTGASGACRLIMSPPVSTQTALRTQP
jgi:hypothetical protein